MGVQGFGDQVGVQTGGGFQVGLDMGLVWLRMREELQVLVTGQMVVYTVVCVWT